VTKVRTAVRLVSVAAVAGLLASCAGLATGPRNKAGGAHEARVLRLADTGSTLAFTPSVEYFVSRVAELSHGQLRVDVVHRWGQFEPDAERQEVRAVAAGKVDLGWVGARVFDTMGVNDLQALQAPMLIDSYPLAKAVVTSDVADVMLKSVAPLGVQGIGMLVNGLRKPIATHKPFTGPASWHGATFATYGSQVQSASIRALGARPVVKYGPPLNLALADRTVQGFEKSLFIYVNNAMTVRAPYVTINVNLWPELDMLVAHPGSLSSLDDQQRGWLRQASGEATRRSFHVGDDDATLLRELCDSGSRVAVASPADLAALRQAFAPVYAAIERNPTTRSAVARIEALKGRLGPQPSMRVPAGCTGEAPRVQALPASARARFAGTYRWTLTRADASANGDATVSDYPITVNMVLGRDGSWRLDTGQQETGTYTATANMLRFVWPRVVGTLVFRVRADPDGTLHLTAVPPMDPGDKFVWSLHPWRRIG
jgi:TRAP-type C4-dicarboxylate transport system substrate-binding protein